MNAVRTIVTGVLCLATASAVWAKDIYVSPTGNDASEDPGNPDTPYKTIDMAITSAAGGDVIHIAAGTYKESKTWTIDKALTIKGEGSALTISQANKFQLNHADAVIEDMRITGWGASGSLTFVKAGAGGTARRCDISGNTRTSTSGTGVEMHCGNLIDCTITNNVNSSGGNGVGLYIGASDDCLVENCLIADNDTAWNSGVGGVYITHENTFNGFNVTLRHCTIVRNVGGDAGGLSLNGNANILLEDCIVADNFKTKDATASNTEDAFLGWTANYTRTLKNCIIAKCPTYNAGYVVENCLMNVGAGLTQPYEGDCSIGRQSAAWGAGTDGSDIGCQQTDHGEAFAVGCYAETDRGIGSVKTILHGTAVNATGSVTYEWDLDGDGAYEASGATVETTFSTLGWNSVAVRATCNGVSDETTVEHVVCVFAPTTYVWSQSPNPTFPYATWETAAHLPLVGLSAVIDGGKLQFTNEAFAIAKPLNVRRRMELCGTGRENNSVLGGVAGFTVPKFTDVNAKGTSIQRTSGDVINLKLFNSGSLVHSIAFGPGRSQVVAIYGESVVSNCTVRYGEYTGGNGVGVWANAGLITHCVISNSYNYNNSVFGGEVYLEGSAKLRNSLVTGGRHTGGNASPGCQGAVCAKGNAEVMNCTIVGNQAGIGAGLYTDGAGVKILNNIIRDNVTTCDSSAHPDWFDKTGTGIYSNNCMAVAHHDGDGTVTAAPNFISDETGVNTWTFPASSPCVNKGFPVAWATEDATDLFGNLRVQGNAIDIGCFEADMSQTVCDISAEPAEATGAATVTFNAVIIGTEPPPTAQYLWDFDGDGVFELSGKSVVVNCGEGYHSATLKVVDGDNVLFLVEGKTDLVKVYPKTLYFDAANAEGAAFPYNTPETAAAKMSDVIASAKEGATVLVAAGRHDCDVQILVNVGVTFKPVPGCAEPPTLVRQFGGGLGSFVSIGSPAALLEGLVFDDNKQYSQNVVVNDGTVRDCVISNGYYTTGGGIGLAMAGGLVDRCEIVGTRGMASEARTDVGLVISMSGMAVLRNSFIHGNYADDKTKGRRSGLIAVRGQAVLENCTIVGNTNRQYSVVATIGGGTVRNCIIADNECGDTNVLNSPYWPSFSPIVDNGKDLVLDETHTADFDYNCYTSVTATVYGEHDLLGDVKFKNAAKGDYTVRTTSPAYLSSLKQEWMTEDALDFLGNPRVKWGCADRGAIQCQRGSGTTILVR